MSVETEVVPDDIFLPATTVPIDSLFAGYIKSRSAIENTNDVIKNNTGSIMYFLSGYRAKNRHTYLGSLTDIFDADSAVAALDADYWRKAMAMTDVLDFMPSKKRTEWNENITEHKTPPFDRGTVMNTMQSLMAQRMDFLAEMVDGIFTGLSGEHITNRPEGFGKRMIIGYLYSSYSGGKNEGLIHDMRCVIARFTGAGQPTHQTSRHLLESARKTTGKWHLVDGGAFRLRVYKKGTGHIEINSNIAYRLNQILAYLHPMAIPAPHRRQPAKRPKKEFQMIQRPIPSVVLTEIVDRRYEGSGLSMGYGWKDKDKFLRKAVDEVMQAIGGTLDGCTYNFDYDAREVIREITMSGIIPDQKSHQYYPTPEPIAKRAIELADIQDGNWCLEPSAGQGGLAEHMPIEYTSCIEINEMNCKILEAKGFGVIRQDFLGWGGIGVKYDRIIMNPPFSDGRAQAHIEHAAEMLKDGGRLVAILPASFRNKTILPELDITIMTATKGATQ